MKTSYQKISDAIALLKAYKVHSSAIEEVAAKLETTPEALDLLFKDWSGVGVEDFFEHFANIKKRDRATVSQLTLFGTDNNPTEKEGPVHASKIRIKRMRVPNTAGQGILHIFYSFSDSPFGSVIIASTAEGICLMAFEEDRSKARQQLQDTYPFARLSEKRDSLQEDALKIFEIHLFSPPAIDLYIGGTEFQFKVWNALLHIPFGKTLTYRELAQKIGRPKASRAVGTAIGSNSIAYLIPCHRVIQSTGATGHFKWGGSTRKTALLGWEAAQISLQL